MDISALQTYVLRTFPDLNATAGIFFRNTAKETGMVFWRLRLTGMAIGPDAIVVESPNPAELVARAGYLVKHARQAQRDGAHARRVARAARHQEADASPFEAA